MLLFAVRKGELLRVKYRKFKTRGILDKSQSFLIMPDRNYFPTLAHSSLASYLLGKTGAIGAAARFCIHRIPRLCAGAALMALLPARIEARAASR